MSTKPDCSQQLAAAIAGDAGAFAGLFESHRVRLERMVAARMDHRLGARLNESDVLQDVFVEAQRRIADFDPEQVPLFIWLRSLTGQRLIQLFRFHLQAEKRAVGRELNPGQALPDASSMSLAGFFVSQLTAVSQAAQAAEMRDRVRAALDKLDDLDREVISMRYFEQLSNEETAMVLELNPSSTSTRHLRALGKLKQLLETDPALADFLGDFGFGVA